MKQFYHKKFVTISRNFWQKSTQVRFCWHLIHLHNVLHFRLHNTFWFMQNDDRQHFYSVVAPNYVLVIKKTLPALYSEKSPVLVIRRFQQTFPLGNFVQINWFVSLTRTFETHFQLNFENKHLLLHSYTSHCFSFVTKTTMNFMCLYRYSSSLGLCFYQRFTISKLTI